MILEAPLRRRRRASMKRATSSRPDLASSRLDRLGAVLARLSKEPPRQPDCSPLPNPPRSGGGGSKATRARIGFGPMDDEYLAHVQYPATKADLIALAEEQGASQETIEALQRADGESFASVDEVRQAILHEH